MVGRGLHSRLPLLLLLLLLLLVVVVVVVVQFLLALIHLCACLFTANPTQLGLFPLFCGHLHVFVRGRGWCTPAQTELLWLGANWWWERVGEG